jgi:hypothetical protein
MLAAIASGISRMGRWKHEASYGWSSRASAEQGVIDVRRPEVGAMHLGVTLRALGEKGTL